MSVCKSMKNSRVKVSERRGLATLAPPGSATGLSTFISTFISTVITTVILAGTGYCLSAMAQTTAATNRAPAHIHWQLLVLLDEKQVDSFSGDTAVGQSQSATHHYSVSHPVGCEGAQTTPTDFSRTITVSPLGVDSSDVIGFEISADEIIADDVSQVVQSSGCTLPPQTRTISARHPELDVSSGKSNDWMLLKKHPLLVYHLTATVIPRGSSQ